MSLNVDSSQQRTSGGESDTCKGESTLRFLLGVHLDPEAGSGGWPPKMPHLICGGRGEGKGPLFIFLSPCCIHRCPNRKQKLHSNLNRGSLI